MQAVEAQSNQPWFIFLCGFGFRHIRRIAYPEGIGIGSGALAQREATSRLQVY
jgi:hypothetical protein